MFVYHTHHSPIAYYRIVWLEYSLSARVHLVIAVLREVDILPSRYTSSGYEVRGTENLRVANQTCDELRLDSRFVLGT